MPNKPKKHGLTEYQEALCQHRAADRGATLAEIAKRAGSKATDENLRKSAHKEFSKPEVKARLAELQKESAEKLDVTKGQIIRGLMDVAFADLRKLYDEDGNFISVHELPDDVAACLAGVEFVTKEQGKGPVEYVAKIKTNDRMKALELLGKYLGMYTEKVEHSGGVTMHLDYRATRSES